jgi:hypothetical protein
MLVVLVNCITPVSTNLVPDPLRPFPNPEADRRRKSGPGEDTITPGPFAAAWAIGDSGNSLNHDEYHLVPVPVGTLEPEPHGNQVVEIGIIQSSLFIIHISVKITPEQQGQAR